VSHPPLIVQVLLLMLVIPAAMFDVKQRRVPNVIVLAGLLLGIGLNLFLYETDGLWMSLKGCGLAFLVYFPLYLVRGMGAGDVKLMAAIGAIVGTANWLGILVLTSLVAGAAAAAMVISRGRVSATLQNIWIILTSLRYGQAPYRSNPDLDVRSDKGIRLPHALMIACGAVGFLVVSAIWAPR
jgi:prepilin peptidase CpaA